MKRFSLNLRQRPNQTCPQIKRRKVPSSILIALLLQFNMAFRGVWTAKARSLREDLSLCKSIFNLALVSSKRPPRESSSSGDHLNPAAFPLSLPTYMYLIDGRLVCQDLVHSPVTYILPAERAADNKANRTDFFRNYMHTNSLGRPPSLHACRIRTAASLSSSVSSSRRRG